MANYSNIAVKINRLAHQTEDKSKRQALFKLKSYLTYKALNKNEVNKVVPQDSNYLVVFKGRSRPGVHIPKAIYHSLPHLFQ